DRRPKMVSVVFIVSQPSVPPMSGDRTMKIAVFSKNGASRQPKPALQIAAPAIPPRSAWDEDVGRPTHHVRRSQTIAPTGPAPTRPSVTTWGSTPFAMLPATWVEKTRNAMKLKNAAQATAARGERTRVETTVAIEFAAS